MVKLLSPENSDDGNKIDHLGSGYFAPSHPTNVDDCDFQYYSSDYDDMFYLDSNEDKAYLDQGDGKEAKFNEDYSGISNEVLLLNTDCQDFISCEFQYYNKDHDVTETYEKENIGDLHCKKMVMLGPLVNYSPFELIDALNMETNSIGIILSSFDQEYEVCSPPIHNF